jgi:hypothetical protein
VPHSCCQKRAEFLVGEASLSQRHHHRRCDQDDPQSTGTDASIELAWEVAAEVDVLLAEPGIYADLDQGVEELSGSVSPVGPGMAEEQISTSISSQVVLGNGVPDRPEELTLGSGVGQGRWRRPAGLCLKASLKTERLRLVLLVQLALGRLEFPIGVALRLAHGAVDVAAELLFRRAHLRTDTRRRGGTSCQRLSLWSGK